MSPPHGNCGKKKKPDHPVLQYFKRGEDGLMVCQIKIDNENDERDQETLCGNKITIAELGEKTIGRVYIIIPPPHLVGLKCDL